MLMNMMSQCVILLSYKGEKHDHLLFKKLGFIDSVWMHRHMTNQKVYEIYSAKGGIWSTKLKHQTSQKLMIISPSRNKSSRSQYYIRIRRWLNLILYVPTHLNQYLRLYHWTILSHKNIYISCYNEYRIKAYTYSHLLLTTRVCRRQTPMIKSEVIMWNGLFCHVRDTVYQQD